MYKRAAATEDDTIYGGVQTRRYFTVGEFVATEGTRCTALIPRHTCIASPNVTDDEKMVVVPKTTGEATAPEHAEPARCAGVRRRAISLALAVTVVGMVWFACAVMRTPGTWQQVKHAAATAVRKPPRRSTSTRGAWLSQERSA